MVHPLRDRQSPFRSSRDPVLIDRQCHHQAAVFGRQRKYRIHHFSLSVYGVDHRLAVIAPQCFFHCHDIRGIDLQRQIRDRLQFLHHFFHHRRLIDLRQPDIDIEHIGLLVLLHDPLLQDIIHVMRTQRFFKFLLTGRIDAFADQDRFPAKLHRMGIGSDQGVILFTERYRLQLLYPCDHRADVGRCSTAATAQHPGTLSRDLFHRSPEAFRLHIVDGLSVLGSRESCIGIDDHRYAGILCQFVHDLHHLIGAQTAVDAHRIHPQAFRHGDYRSRIRSGQQFVRLVIRRCQKYRQARFLGCQHGCLRLVQIVHGLHQDQIYACCHPCFDDLQKDLIRIFKIQIPERFQQFSEGSDIQRHIVILRHIYKKPGIRLPAMDIHSLFRHFDGRTGICCRCRNHFL